MGAADKLMRIAAFYANIREAARQSGLPVGDVLRELRALGLESVYFSLSMELKPDEAAVCAMLDACGLRVEVGDGRCGLHAHSTPRGGTSRRPPGRRSPSAVRTTWFRALRVTTITAGKFTEPRAAW